MQLMMQKFLNESKELFLLVWWKICHCQLQKMESGATSTSAVEVKPALHHQTVERAANTKNQPLSDSTVTTNYSAVEGQTKKVSTKKLPAADELAKPRAKSVTDSVSAYTYLYPYIYLYIPIYLYTLHFEESNF